MIANTSGDVTVTNPQTGSVSAVVVNQQLYAAQNRYANARYDYLFNSFKLHESAGTLTLEAVLALDKWFE